MKEEKKEKKEEGFDLIGHLIFQVNFNT